VGRRLIGDGLKDEVLTAGYADGADKLERAGGEGAPSRRAVARRLTEDGSPYRIAF